MIFDMDGVLIDSEPLYVEMNDELFAELGVSMTREEYHRFVGMSSPLMWKIIRDEHSLPQSVESLMSMEKERIHRLLCSDRISSPVGGVENLLEEFKRAGYPMCVASSSARKNVEAVLNKLDLRRYFASLTCGEDVKHGKPAPDIFLKAAASIGVKPEYCTVIEDSANGLMGAKSAGMKCVAYAGDADSKQDFSAADLTVHSFLESERLRIIRFLEDN